MGVSIFRSRVLWLAVLVAVIAIPLFYVLTFQRHPETGLHLSDNAVHARYVVRGIETGIWPPHVLYQWLLWAVSFGSTDMDTLKHATAYLLAALVFAKAAISYRILDARIQDETVSFLVAAALLFAAPVANWWSFPGVYFGQISPTVWHSPTTILSAPLCILLFFAACGSLEERTRAGYLAVSLLLVLNACAKPNYLLGFLPVFGIVYLFHFRRHPASAAARLAYLAVLFVPVLTVLASQYIFKFGGESAGPAIQFAPFEVWRLRTPSIPASLALSFAFPAAYTLCYWREALREKRIVCAWGVSAVSLLVFTLFAETGRRLYHANFSWGNHLSMTVLFLACSAFFFGKRRKSPKDAFILSLFTLHVATGLFYYGRQLLGLSYG